MQLLYRKQPTNTTKKNSTKSRYIIQIISRILPHSFFSNSPSKPVSLWNAWRALVLTWPPANHIHKLLSTSTINSTFQTQATPEIHKTHHSHGNKRRREVGRNVAYRGGTRTHARWHSGSRSGRSCSRGHAHPSWGHRLGFRGLSPATHEKT